MAKRALEGVRVLDLTQIWAGPYCCRVLSDMGAEIIKVESARRFDGSRSYGVFAQGLSNSPPWERRALFNHKNRGRFGITIDMTLEKGKELFLRLLQVSDIVVENFSARVMHNWGLDYPVLCQHKPDLIMISMPAFGMTGPERDYVGQGSNLTPLSGLVALTGYIDDVPHNVGAYTDPIAGMTGAGALLAALHYKAETGEGQYIDLAQREGAARLIGDAIMDFTMNGRVWPLAGNQHPAHAPHGCYPCRGEDRWVTIAVSSDEGWHAFCKATGHPEWMDDPRFSDAISRWHNQGPLNELISAWTADRDSRDVMELLQAAGVPSGAVHTVPDMLDDPQLTARGYIDFIDINKPEFCAFPSLGVYAKLSKTPGYTTSGRPALGEHNEYVFQSILGMSAEEFGALTAEGIIATDPTKVAP